MIFKVGPKIKFIKFPVNSFGFKNYLRVFKFSPNVPFPLENSHFPQILFHCQKIPCEHGIRRNGKVSSRIEMEVEDSIKIWT